MKPEGANLAVRFRGSIPGIADSDWLRLTPGISVLTGRNNVGKSRVLMTVANLVGVAGSAVSAPDVRLETEVLSIEVGFDEGSFPNRYDVDEGGKTTRGSWHQEENQWQVRLDGNAIFTEGTGAPPPILNRVGDRLPHIRFVEQVFQRLVYLPPQRRINAVVPTTPASVPTPSGEDLGNVIFTHLNSNTPKFEEFQSVAMNLFPEIDRILTVVSGPNQVTITFSDRFSGQAISLQDSGTGVGQALHLIGMVIFCPAGRIFLIDEPHVYLHPGAERLLVRFLQEHPEHSYVCATHSPVFINAAEPERCWLVTRGDNGTRIQSVFEEGLMRQHILSELGIEPGDVALAERIIFVEGESDELVYPILLRRLGWDPVMTNCAIVDMRGAGTARPVSQVLAELGDVLHTSFTICLDGDRRGQAPGDQHVRFLPVPELEDLFLGDASAIRDALLSTLEGEEAVETVGGKWSVAGIEAFITEHQGKHPGGKGSKVLTDLAWEMGTPYSKRVHDPMIAEALRADLLEPLRGTFGDLFPGTPG